MFARAANSSTNLCLTDLHKHNKEQIELYLLCAEEWAQTVCSKGFQAGSALSVFYLASAA